MRFIYDRQKTAVVYKNKEYSYKDIIKTLKYYTTLYEIQENEKVVVTMENRPEFICSLFSIWEKKGIGVVLDSGYTIEQYIYAFQNSEAKCVITSKKIEDTVRKAIEESGLDIQVIVVDEVTVPENYEADSYEVDIDDMERIALLLYTSGTTGNPKGVMLTFNNLHSNINAVKEIELVNENDRVLALLPFHHILPLNLTLLMPVYFGTFLAILDELSSEAIKSILKKQKISVIIGVPRVWEMLHKGIMSKINASWLPSKLFKLCKKIGNEKLSKKVFKKVSDELGGNMRVIVSGGAKLNPEIISDFNTLGLPIIEGYGLTETSPIIAFNQPGKVRVGSVGTIIPKVTVKLGEDDEILVKGANVMKGYYKNPMATSEAIDSDGWFHTGDLGKLEDDYLYIVGRKKEMIVLSNGKNINPGDIENEILQKTDLIKELAVIEYNNHLMAIVHPNFDILRQRKIANIKETLKWEIIDSYNVTAPAYRKILEIKVTKEELPKTKLGKIRRFMLKDFLKDMEEESSNTKVNKKEKKKVEIPIEIKEEYETLKNYIENTFNVEVEPESHLELDLGLDSLDLVEILSFIEGNYGIKINEAKFSEFNNILEIAKYIKDNGGNFHNEEMNWKTIFDQDIDLKLPKTNYIANIFKLLLKPIFLLYLRLKVEDSENIIDQPAIYVGNHQSFIDAFAFNESMPNSKLKDTYYIAVATHFESPIRKFFASRGNVVLIDINKNLKDTLQISAKILKEGKNLVIFPEGARTRDGELQQFKKTFAILSKELNIPVVPFGIDGAYDSMPYGCNFPRPNKITLKFFEAIEPKTLTVDEIVSKTRETIKEWID